MDILVGHRPKYVSTRSVESFSGHDISAQINCKNINLKEWFKEDWKFCHIWLYRHSPVCRSVRLWVGGGDWGMVWAQRSEAVGRLLSFRFTEFSFCPFSGDPNLPDKDTAFSSILAHWLSLWPCPLKHGCYECFALPCVYVCSQNHYFECLSGSVCVCLPGHIRCV